MHVLLIGLNCSYIKFRQQLKRNTLTQWLRSNYGLTKEVTVIGEQIFTIWNYAMRTRVCFKECLMHDARISSSSTPQHCWVVTSPWPSPSSHHIAAANTNAHLCMVILPLTSLWIPIQTSYFLNCYSSRVCANIVNFTRVPLWVLMHMWDVCWLFDLYVQQKHNVMQLHQINSTHLWTCMPINKYLETAKESKGAIQYEYLHDI